MIELINLSNLMKSIKLASLIFGTIFFLPLLSFSQKQPGIPGPSEPLNLSDKSDLVIFIIIPVIILILFLIFRKRIFRIKEEKRERMRKEMEEKRKKTD
ncbi:hypothetical protein SAMN04488104_1001219 [Algoriphagus faecimaris]|uniref:Uncharacterized protein n=2 Tax=Algoriphagus faecimaris TaxID=686796 RepID=A0A1G6MJ58_9BACT|nr:hypothetical protein SAMN04488104_1001219 [Algoriphagus faecimaris]